MTPNDVTLVQHSFKKVPDTAAELFYARLFGQAPHLRPMFGPDIRAQAKKLLAMLAVAVNGLDNIEALLPVVRDLGARHVGYGVKAEHYEIVGEALIWTLEQGLGDEFTEDVRNAWTEVYGALSSTMIDAAHSKAA